MQPLEDIGRQPGQDQLAACDAIVIEGVERDSLEWQPMRYPGEPTSRDPHDVQRWRHQLGWLRTQNIARLQTLLCTALRLLRQEDERAALVFGFAVHRWGIPDVAPESLVDCGNIARRTVQIPAGIRDQLRAMRRDGGREAA